MPAPQRVSEPLNRASVLRRCGVVGRDRPASRSSLDRRVRRALERMSGDAYVAEPADPMPVTGPPSSTSPWAIAGGAEPPLPDVSGQCEQRLLAQLERLRVSVPAGADPALAAMVHAADEVAADWRERVQEVERSRRRLDDA